MKKSVNKKSIVKPGSKKTKITPPAKQVNADSPGVSKSRSKLTKQTFTDADAYIRNVFMQAPVSIVGYKGPSFIVDMINEKALEMWGTSYEKTINKPLFEISPELHTSMEKVLTDVYITGKPYIANEFPAKFKRNGKWYEGIFNFVLNPVKELNGSIVGITSIGTDVTQEVIARKKVEESEQRFRALVNATSNVVYRMNADWSEMTNLEGRGILSDTDEPIKDWLQKYIHPDDQQRVSDAIAQAIRTKSIFQLEHQVKQADGSLGWTFSRAIPIFNQDGQIIEWFGAATDVTERKRAEFEVWQAREESEKRKRVYETITQNTPDLIYVFDLNYRFTYANEALLAMWGRNWNDSNGKGLRELGYEEWHAAMHEREIDEVIATKKSIRGTVAFPHAELGKRTYDYIFAPVLDNADQVIAIAGTTRDISEITKSEEMTKESEAQLSFAIAATELAVWDYNPITNKFRANDRLKHWFGLETAEEIDLSLAIAVMAEKDRPRVTAAIQKALQWGGGDYDIEYTIINPLTFEERIVRAQGKAAFNHDKLAYRFNGTLQDITLHAQARKKIEESEKRFRNTFYNNMVPMAVWTVEGGIVDANDALLDMLHYTRTELENGLINWTDITPPEFTQLDTKAVNEVLTKGFCTPYEKIFLTKLGHRVPILIGGGRFDESGESGLFFAIDLTERNKAEEKLKESEQQFSTLANNIQNLAWIANGQGWIYWYNQRWYDYTGTTFEEMKGWGWEKVQHPDHVTRVVDFVKKAWAKNEPWELTFPLRSHSGAFEWFLTRAYPITDTAGNIIRWVGTNTNVEKQKMQALEFENAVKERTIALRQANIDLELMNKQLLEAGEELKKQEVIRENEKNLRTILAGLPQLAWRSDVDGTDIYFNKQWSEYAGITEDQLKKNGWISVLHPDDLKWVQPKWKEALETRQPIELEYRLRAKDGIYHWFLTRAEPFIEPDNNIKSFIGTSTNIDAAKRIREELEQQRQRREDFIKMASHELKTPITTIKGYIQLVLGTVKDKEQISPLLVKSSLLTMEKQVNRLTKLMTELLDISRVETGQLDLNKDTFSLNELLMEVVQDVHYSTPNSNIVISHDFECSLFADRNRIGQVITNLLVNAIKYSPKSNKIEVRIFQPASTRVAISVKDYGIGIDVKEQEKIFDRFYRAEGKSEQTYPGFGVGLFLAAEILERHGGSIKVRSEKGEGSTFTFDLPV